MQNKYLMARKNLLLMLVLTVINIILFAVGADVMLLFSATVPYYSVVFGMVLGSRVLLIAGIVIAIVSLGLYLLCWIFSKKHYGWMIAALVLFILDTLTMISLYILLGDFSGVLDVAIHAWVLYYLVIGVRYGYQLKNTPMEMPAAEAVEVAMACEEESTYLRRADVEVKHRIFVEADMAGRHICFRRVKRTNELVIDGYVYAEVEMLVETAHELKANIDGHLVQAGFDGIMHSYIKVDGAQVAKKIRLY